MAWTYTNSPATSQRDEVRFLVGDTVSTEQLVSDEEIAYAIVQNSNIKEAASIIAEAIAMKFATMKTSVKIGPIAEEYGNRAEFYAKRAKELKNNASSSVTLNIDSGTSYNSDGTERPMSFSIGMTDSVTEAVIDE